MIDVESISACEKVERDAWLDLFAAAPAVLSEQLELKHTIIHGLGLLACPAIPITELNRAMALGAEQPVSDEELAEALQWLNIHADAWAFQINPALNTSATIDWLRKQELAPASNGWAKFYLHHTAISDTSHPPSAYEIRPVETHDADNFGLVVQSGFGLPEQVRPWFSALVGREKWKTYLAWDNNRPVAAGAMYIDHQTAWLGIDTTLAELRQKGTQRALIMRRLRDGKQSGVTAFTAETGHPATENEPGYSSFRNYLNSGFNKICVRQNYKK